MIKSIIVLIILSVVAVLGAPYLHHALGFVLSIEKTVYGWLSHIFARTTTGVFLAKTIALAIIPIIAALIILGVLIVVKKKNLLFTEYVMWVVWVVLFTVLTYKG